MFREKDYLSEDIRGTKFSINSLENNGFYILENSFSEEGIKILSKIRDCLIYESESQKKIISNLTGYKLGNLNIEKCFIHKEIWNLLKTSVIIEEIFKYFDINKIQDIKSVGGNINLPQSIPQAFHRDSSLQDKYLMMFIALEKITSLNGAQEIISDKNVNGIKFIDMLKSRFKYGSILLSMNPGDILFRYSSTWHRGTKNSSLYPRAVPLFTISLGTKKTKNNTKVDIHSFEKKISFRGNYAPEGILRNLYIYLACNFTRIFHFLIYLTKLFREK